MFIVVGDCVTLVNVGVCGCMWLGVTVVVCGCVSLYVFVVVCGCAWLSVAVMCLCVDVTVRVYGCG